MVAASVDSRLWQEEVLMLPILKVKSILSPLGC